MASTLWAQVGINIENPREILHVDVFGNTPQNNETQNQTSDDFIIETTTGNIGVGTLNPKVKFDLRNETGNSALGIGNSDYSATTAGKGAIRYDGNYLQYSNGQAWTNLVPADENKIKTIVIATKISQDTYAYEPGGHNCNNCNVTGAPHRTSAFLTNWTQKYNNTTDGGTFDASSGTFTANRDGVFVASFTFALESGRIWAWNGSANPLDSNQIEAIWRIYDTNGVEISSIKCANSFPSDSRQNYGSNGNSRAGSYCTGSINLSAGQKIRPALWIDLNPSDPRLFDLTLINSSSIYNNLTIVEK